MQALRPALALLVLASSPAIAEPLAAIHVVRPDDPHIEIERAGASVRDVGDYQLVSMTVIATASSPVWQYAELGMSIPRTARLVGLAIEQNDRTYTGEPVVADTARDRFIRNLDISLDPALVELVAHGRDYDRLRLALFPVSSDQSAKVRMIVAVPRAERVVVDVAGQRVEHRAGPAMAPTRTERALLEAPGVTDARSLYAAPANDEVTAAELRYFVRGSGVDSCTLADDNTVAHLTIAADGRVTVRTIANVTGEASDCIRRALESGHVHPGVGPIFVAYPLRRAR